MNHLRDYLRDLPRHPFKLARALVRAPLVNTGGPETEAELGAWTQRFPLLIVHDQVQVAAGIHALLRMEGWRALICTSGRDALLVAEAVPISLVTIGPNLPDMTQCELIREMARREETRRIPMIILVPVISPADFRPYRVQAVALNIPFEHDDLVFLVRESLLVKGNWRWPSNYNADRAGRVLHEHVVAR